MKNLKASSFFIFIVLNIKSLTLLKSSFSSIAFNASEEKTFELFARIFIFSFYTLLSASIRFGAGISSSKISMSAKSGSVEILFVIRAFAKP